jgi:hypothetical protein
MAGKTTDLRAMKLEHIKREYDSARSYAERRGTRIDLIRGWNVTVIGGYMALRSEAEACHDLSVLPLLGVISLFWIMEAFAAASVRLLIDYTLNQADRLFSASSDDFEKRFAAYEFINSVQTSRYKEWCSNGGRLDRFSQGLLNCQTGVFYFAPMWILFSIHYLPWRDVPSWFFLAFSVILFVAGPIIFVLACFHRDWLRRRVRPLVRWMCRLGRRVRPSKPT